MSELFGLTIRTKRIHNHLTQKELAQLCDVTPTYISKIEHGAVIPSESLICRLAGIFGIDDNWLLDMAGNLDIEALQEIARLDSRISKVLRRIQKRQFSIIQLDLIVQLLEDTPD